MENMKNYAIALSVCCATVVSAMDHSSRNNTIKIPISYEDWQQVVRLIEKLDKHHMNTYHQPQPLMFFDVGKRARDDFFVSKDGSRSNTIFRKI